MRTPASLTYERTAIVAATIPLLSVLFSLVSDAPIARGMKTLPSPWFDKDAVVYFPTVHMSPHMLRRMDAHRLQQLPFGNGNVAQRTFQVITTSVANDKAVDFLTLGRSSLPRFASVLCVVNAYVGSYLAVLRPTIYVEQSLGGIGVGYREPDYRFGGRLARVFFAPASWIDRRLWPAYWNSWSNLNDR